MDLVIDNLKESIEFVKRDLNRQKLIREQKLADLKVLEETITKNEEYIIDCEMAIGAIKSLGDSKLYTSVYKSKDES